ncbi:MAG: hypothetical protein J6K31_06800 [Parabacteroides sp.]|nr:hypothetical protein [Parabacteroides sp.]
MNKRFSTLLASALLAVGSFSASATVGTAVGSLAIGNNEGKLYQLVTAGDSVLAIQNDSLKLMPVANANASILNTLWCVNVERYNQGQAIKFEFRNKATGQLLEVSEDYLTGLPAGATTADLEVGGAIGGWAFSNALKPLQQARSLYYYFNGDSVVTLDKSAAGVDIAGNAYLALTKREAKEDNDYVSDNATAFTLVEADAITLTAEQINTVLGTQEATAGVKLKFHEDKNKVSQKNYFTDDAKFFASEVENEDWVRIITGKKEDSTFVYVDTTYTNANGVMFLDFATQQLKHAKLSKNTTGHTTVADSLGMLDDQAKFLFTYWPSIDSLVIQVKQITNLNGKANFAAAYVAGDTANIATGNDDPRNYVTVQDLVEADDIRIVTIYDKKETEISFGISGCGEYVGNKTTLDEGLYLIKNKENKYLAVPIHEDSIPQWVSLEDNVEPWDMPSFQWVVEKKRKNSDVSALKITNREFEKVVVADGLQLYNDADATILGAAVEVEKGFDKASAEVMADAHRGYRFLNNDSLKVTAYKLQYWTAFASDDLYMGAMKSGDSVIYVGAKDNYVLAPTGTEANFGYKGAVEGLAQLKRQAYTMKSRGTNKMVVEAGENRIAVSDAAAADTAKFFFKANNNVNGKIYYALIDTAFKQAPDSLRKVGVDENNKYLKRQIMTETRTSAFSVEVDNTPVYRRFDSFKLEGNEGDAADTLRFVEKYRGEFLQMEANQHFMVDGIDFLGIDAVNKGEGKSFYVDTAWVNRGLGYIKPQYLVSIDRVPAEDVVIRKKCPLCAEMGDAAPDHCIHDEYITEEGFERGKYLVNFVDSVANKDYAWGKYSRVGFVDALHIGDSLYLLLDQFAGLDTKDIDIVAIEKADSTYQANVGKDGNNNGRYIKNLKGDEHKAYTWSFRFVDLENSAVEEEPNRAFLFESLPKDAADKIQPQYASWLKMQNGCLVMSDPNESTFNEITTGGDDALIFNIEEGSKDDVATDNEVIATSEVTVIAGEGQVTIAGAAGKKVVITNILGQTVANTVLSSDNATIAAPAGVVVVAVEGEEAVKAIVK